MGQGFAIIAQGPPQPFVVHSLNTPASDAELIDDVTVVWDDGHSDPFPAGPIPPATSYASLTFDTTLFAWLIVAVKSSGFVLVKEKDQATIDTMIGGTPTRAVMARIADGMPPYFIPQV